MTRGNSRKVCGRCSRNVTIKCHYYIFIYLRLNFYQNPDPHNSQVPRHLLLLRGNITYEIIGLQTVSTATSCYPYIANNKIYVTVEAHQR